MSKLYRPCPKSRLDELGTEPVAVATGCFQREITHLLPQAVPYQIGDPTHILSYGGKASFTVGSRRNNVRAKLATAAGRQAPAGKNVPRTGFA
jgi:hypothetical protein